MEVPCVTRWNSRFDAVSKVCKPNVKPHINRLIQRLSAEIRSAAHLQLVSNSDWAVLQEYVRVMEPIATALDILQGEKKSCQGYIIPTLTSMHYHISQLEGHNVLQSFKKAALEVISKRFDRYLKISYGNPDMILSAVSHPSFKTSFIEEPTDERKARDILKSECIKLLNEKQNTTDEIETETSTESNKFFVSFPRSNVRRNSIEDDIGNEISKFLSDSRMDESMLNEYPVVKEVFF